MTIDIALHGLADLRKHRLPAIERRTATGTVSAKQLVHRTPVLVIYPEHATMALNDKPRRFRSPSERRIQPNHHGRWPQTGALICPRQSFLGHQSIRRLSRQTKGNPVLPNRRKQLTPRGGQLRHSHPSNNQLSTARRQQPNRSERDGDRRREPPRPSAQPWSVRRPRRRLGWPARGPEVLR
jgi:hypothetical protein